MTNSKQHDSPDEKDDLPDEEKGISRDEAEDIEERSRLRAAVVYEIIRIEGEGELGRSFSALWWSGLAAGLSIGLSVISQAMLAAHLPETDW